MSVDLDNGQIGFHIAGDKPCNVSSSVGQGHLNVAHTVNHVVVGDNVSACVDNHAGAHAVDAAIGISAGSLTGLGGYGFFAPDIDHRCPHSLDRLDDRRLTLLRSSGRRCKQKATKQ